MVTAREIVRNAASQVETQPAKSWLERDERGTWEKQAQDLIAQYPETFETHGDDAIRQAGNILAVRALDAVIRTNK
jgi:hypothetical protein